MNTRPENPAVKELFDLVEGYNTHPRAKVLIAQLSQEDINTQDLLGGTALMKAVRLKYYEIAHELIKNSKSNLNLQDNREDSALTQAINLGRIEIALELIASKRCDLDIESKAKETALSIAAKDGHKEIVHELILNHCNIDHQDWVGNTPLMTAAYNGHKEIVHELILNHCNLDLQDCDGDTPLIRAVLKGNKEIACELIQAGADVNIINKGGKTALFYAAEKGDKEIACELIQAGADITIVNKVGQTALCYAIEERKLLVIVLLLKHGAQIREPKVFLDFLNSYDQRDPDILTCLNALILQQQNLYDSKLVDSKIMRLDEKSFQKVKSYLVKLNAVNRVFLKGVQVAVRDSAQSVNDQKEIPVGPLSIISGYDIPIEGDRIRFFKPDETLKPVEVNHIVSDQKDKQVKVSILHTQNNSRSQQSTRLSMVKSKLSYQQLMKSSENKAEKIANPPSGTIWGNVALISVGLIGLFALGNYLTKSNPTSSNLPRPK